MRAREYARRDREMSNEEAMGLAIAGASTLVLLGGAYYWLQNGKKTPAHDQLSLILDVMCRRVDATTIVSDKATLVSIKKELEELQIASKAREGVLESLNGTNALLLAKQTAYDTLTATLAAKERDLAVIKKALADAQKSVENSGGAGVEQSLKISASDTAIKRLNEENRILDDQLRKANEEITTTSAETQRLTQELATHKSYNPATAAEVTALRGELTAAKVAEATAVSQKDAAEKRAEAATMEAAASRALAQQRKDAADASAGLTRQKEALESEVALLKQAAGRTNKQLGELKTANATLSDKIASLHLLEQQLGDSQAATKQAQGTADERHDYTSVVAERDRLTAELVQSKSSVDHLKLLVGTVTERAEVAEKEGATLPTLRGELEAANAMVLAKEAGLLVATTELGRVRDQIVGLQTRVSEFSNANTAIDSATKRAADAEARLDGHVKTRDGDIKKAVEAAEEAKNKMIAVIQKELDDVTNQLDGCEREGIAQNDEILRLRARETDLLLRGQALTDNLGTLNAELLVAKKGEEDAKRAGGKGLADANRENARKLIAEEEKTGTALKQVEEQQGQLLCLHGQKVYIEAQVAYLGVAGFAAEGQRDAAVIATAIANEQRDNAVDSAFAANEHARLVQGQSASFALAVQNETALTANTLGAILAVLRADKTGGEAAAQRLVDDSQKLAALERQVLCAADALDAVMSLVRDLGSTLRGRADADIPEPKRATLADGIAIDKVGLQVRDLTLFLNWIGLLVKADRGADHMDALRGLLVKAGGSAVPLDASEELKGVIVAFGSLIGSGGSSVIARLEAAHTEAGLTRKKRHNVSSAGGMGNMARYVVGLLNDLFAEGRVGVVRPSRTPSRPAREILDAEVAELETGEKEQSAGKRPKLSPQAASLAPKAEQSKEVESGRKRRASDDSVVAEEGKKDKDATARTLDLEPPRTPAALDGSEVEFGVESVRALPMGASLWGHMLGCARRIARARAGAALTLDGARATSAAIGWLLRIVESKLIVRARLEKMSLLPPAAQSFGRGCRGPIRRARMYI